MSGIRRAPLIGSDDWLLQQQLRAEMEAEAWRRLRETLAEPAPAPPLAPQPALQQPAQPISVHRAGSTILKALVRFGLGAFGAYLAWIAAMDGGLGEFEVWLATGSGFLVALSLSMLEPARQFVHFLAETLRYSIIAGVALGVVWMILHVPPGPA